jgi:hypothetical protein
MSVTGATGQQGLQGYAGARGPRGVTGTTGWVNTIYTNTAPFMNPTGPVGPIGQLTIAASNVSSSLVLSSATAGMIYQVSGSGDLNVSGQGTTVGMFWIFQAQAAGRLVFASPSSFYKQFVAGQFVTVAVADTSGNLAFL